MDIYNNSNNMLSVLDGYTINNPDDIMSQVADNFRKRRVEKNITRQRIAELDLIRQKSKHKRAYAKSKN